MNRTQRLALMEETILENAPFVSLPDLCKKLSISLNTARRDLNQLVQNGRIKKVYGGAAPVEKRQDFSAHLHMDNRNLHQRQQIGATAARLVEDGDIIFIDTGFTTCHMVEAIDKEKRVIIITNSVEVILRALPLENLTIIALAGTLDRAAMSLSNPQTAKVLQEYNVSKAFLSTTGFSIARGITNASPFEAEVKKAAISRSEHTFLLADHSKINAAGLATYGTLEDIDALITDRQPPKEMVDFFAANGKRIINN